MLLATAHATRPTFNADFYVAGATVIPVLFLAIAVQGPVLDQLLRQTLAWLVRFSVARRQRPGVVRMTPRALLWYIAAAVPYALAIFVLFCGIGAEVVSFFSLANRENAGPPGLVLSAVVSLTVAAALPAAGSWLRFLGKMLDTTYYLGVGDAARAAQDRPETPEAQQEQG